MFEENIFFVMALTLVSAISADLEHSCTASQLNTTRAKVCGRLMFQFVTQRCNPVQSNPRITASGVESVSITADEANALLNNQAGIWRSGLTCECCVHRCKVSEFEQYCNNPNYIRNSRRKRRSISRRQNRHFTAAGVEEMYSLINKSMRDPHTAKEMMAGKVPVNTIQQISQIKAWKLKNIENKLLAEFGLKEEDAAAVVTTNKNNPPTKVITDESAEHASKPKVFPEVNKDSSLPTQHRHRHKYPTTFSGYSNIDKV